MSSLTAPVTLLSAVVATGASKAVQADAGQPAFLQVTGITTATVAFQGSLDGTTFATIGTALTADGIVTIANAPIGNLFADPHDKNRARSKGKSR